MSHAHIVDVLKRIADVARPEFASFNYVAKGSGEFARHTIIVGVSLESVYMRDIEILSTVVDGLTGWERKAADDLIKSKITSLEAWKKGQHHPNATSADSYVAFPNIHGVKIHKPTGLVHVMAQAHRKKVFERGEYNKVNHGPLVVAKNALTKDLALPGGKIRQFDLKNLTQARMAGDTLVLR